jgi:hypothetical protein
MMTNPTCDWYTMCVLGSFISSYPTCDWYTMCVLGSFISSYPTCDWYTMCVLGSFISPYPTCDWYTVCALDNFLQRSTWNMKSMYDSSFYFTFGNLYLPSTYSFRYDPLFSKLVVISLHISSWTLKKIIKSTHSIAITGGIWGDETTKDTHSIPITGGTWGDETTKDTHSMPITGGPWEDETTKDTHSTLHIFF